MSDILNIAVSGLNAAASRVANAATNIVNASSTNFLPQDIISLSNPAGGVTTQAQPDTSGAGVNVAARHHNNRDHGEVCVRSQPVQNHETVSRRQAEIQNNQIGLSFASFAYRGKSIFGEESVIPIGLEQNVIPEAHIAIVFNHQNFFVAHHEFLP